MRLLLKRSWPRVLILCLLSCVVGSGECRELGVLSLDELLDLEVLSVAKIPGKVIETPAATTVITGEDLRRNNVRTIPEALRLVPGMHVYQIDANKWAISARGFASRFANKMLVMIDGRTVYSTLFSGVFWDVQDMVIDDIERIEVIRGPGGTLWGANAVNGVVNIITKDSADTQGGLVSLQAQTGPGGDVSVRYGDWLNDKTSYRIYGKFFDRDNYEFSGGVDADDDWHQIRAGFRLDSNLTAKNKLTFQGDIYDGKSGESVQHVSQEFPFVAFDASGSPVSGYNLLGRWNRVFSKTSELTFQAYYDHLERDEFIDEILDTIDVDVQQRLNMSESLEILFGFGYRYIRSDTAGKETIPGLYSYFMDPKVREDNLYSAFLQGRFLFASKRGEVTLGSKLEHNDYTGFEWQPSVRILWNISSEHALWAAFSRAVRIPSRLGTDAVINVGISAPPIDGFQKYFRLMGNDNLGSEKVYSYETGYRGRLSKELFVDLSLFYNMYEDIVAVIPAGVPFQEVSVYGSRLVMPVQSMAIRNEETFGAELSCNMAITGWWRLTAGYTWFHLNVLEVGNSTEGRKGFQEDENAEHIFSLASYMDLPGNLEVNFFLYSISALDKLDIGSRTRLDCNLGWYPTDTIAISAGVKNVFDDASQEFPNIIDGVRATEIPRTVYTKLTLTF